MIKVLVVDDDPLTTEFMRLSLHSDRTAVVSAHSCSEAINACEVHHPDIVITDISLGDGSGMDVARVAQSAGAKLIIGVTGHDSSQLQNNGIDITNFSHILLKPIDLEQLNSIIVRHLASIG